MVDERNIFDWCVKRTYNSLIVLIIGDRKMRVALEVGKTYQTVNGGTVVIERDNGDDRFPFFGKIVGVDGVNDRLAYFTALGSYGSAAGPTGFDIHAEVAKAS